MADVPGNIVRYTPWSEASAAKFRLDAKAVADEKGLHDSVV